MDFLIAQASVMDNLQVAGGAIWAIITAHGVAAGGGASGWHLWLRRGGRLNKAHR